VGGGLGFGGGCGGVGFFFFFGCGGWGVESGDREEEKGNVSPRERLPWEKKSKEGPGGENLSCPKKR